MAVLPGIFEKIDDYRWRIPRSFKTGMRTDGIIYAGAEMLELIFSENAHQQVANVACLPGITGSSLAMPDIHLGYGFPIGGVAAFDPENGGIVSPGGVGYDINCGVRLLRTHLHYKEIIPKINVLIDRLAAEVPSGVGAEGTLSLSKSDLDRIMRKGAGWSVEHGSIKPGESFIMMAPTPMPIWGSAGRPISALIWRILICTKLFPLRTAAAVPAPARLG